MENIFKEINRQIQEINNLERKRDELMIQLNRTRRGVIEKMASKPYWHLFISGYCTEGDKEEYIGDIEKYLKYESPMARSNGAGFIFNEPKNISISFENNKVIVTDTRFYRDDYESWTFTIPMKKFIEFCTTDDYMEKVINRYKSIKEAREQRYQKEQEENERALYEKLKQKYEQPSVIEK